MDICKHSANPLQVCPVWTNHKFSSEAGDLVSGCKKRSFLWNVSFAWQVSVSKWKPGAPRRQDREHHSGNTACLGIEPRHTHKLPLWCDAQTFWLGCTEWSKCIDYWQKCERERVVCPTRGDTWAADLWLCLLYVRKLGCRPKTSTSGPKTDFTG